VTVNAAERKGDAQRLGSGVVEGDGFSAPGGTVVVADSGRFTGGSTITITAKRLEANRPAHRRHER